MSELEKIIIAALGRNGVIGAGTRLPWNLPEEYRRFLETIRDQTVIWGRKTFELFSSPPPSAVNIVISRSAKYVANALISASFEEALTTAAQISKRAFIAGGGSIYRQALPYADALYLSWIDGEWEGDVFFPPIDFREWEIVCRNGFAGWEFVSYRRIKLPIGSLQTPL